MFRHSFNQRAKTSFSIEPSISVNLEIFKKLIERGKRGRKWFNPPKDCPENYFLIVRF